jgi:regulator of replication initiation timing
VTELEDKIVSLTSQLNEFRDKLSISSSLNQQLEKNDASLTSRLNETRNQLSEVEKNYNLLSERNLCVICQDAQKTILHRPCNHLCLCGNCASNVTAVRRCPLCNTTITERITVFA